LYQLPDQGLPFWIALREHTQKSDARHRAGLLRARRERPCRRSPAEQRDEGAPFHSLMPPVLPSERIAHLSYGRRLLHPSHVRRNEMIAITPPIISSKEVSPLPGVKRAVINC